MKNSLRYFFTALFASLITIGVFKYFDTPETIIIRERITAQPLSYPGSPGQPVFVKRKIVDSDKNQQTSIFKQSVKAMVQIKSARNNWMGRFRSPSVKQNGSGVILTHNGYIATNYHVVEDSEDIEVLLWNKQSISAQLIGFDVKTDLALLKIDKENLPYIHFGNSDHINVGDKIYALGHPFKMDVTVTEGIVSGLHRQLGLKDGDNILESFIQTDAVINPGNSGGALINNEGLLIGINTAILTRSGNFEGYSFSIPSNLAHKILSDLRTYGYVQRGILGINAEYQPIEESPLSTSHGGGALIHKVEANSPADWGGLKTGDIILSINGQNITSISHLKEILWSAEMGESIPIIYARNQIVDSISVHLVHESDNPDYSILLKFGMEIRPLQKNEIEKYNFSGIRVESIFKNSMASSLNIKPGFIITEINRKPITETQLFYNEFINMRGEVHLAGRYPPDDQLYYYSFNIHHLFQ
ncbi:trypsin-like peptidase domain-containing protein [Membranihabitans marinus]|uniref:trypsin-like peptidase domain-containing protein n=1 Tax=Membranihabitans marinus TaxID=1227546 RepID=UPI001F19427F|nr:trypsin-like peptidase domain-containing protein [Membranihabitans marinus]